ncbi:heat shock 70 kDa protein 12A-like [Thunnus albacares]|uniref:heat shock 70 kDa protein 12A-like n=1 Tax=Thunnus albacares TaxID=8236 RepID=UPI001CF64DF1|nr:heat shock 70 kDa protein 12A-like [Thunnus albacares]
MGDSYIIAIDFGTAYSGYAFSLTSSEEQIEPNLKRWGKELGLDTPKTPTCILFNEDEEFLKFGYEARAAYIKMCGEEAKQHYYFEAFKMALYGKKLNRDVTIKAANGKSMNAMKVFTAALSYLKEDALKTISDKIAGMKFIASDFTWVLTVPAIWDSSAKQFMREAATKAGIVSNGTEDRLVIALEPEAASVWCKKLPAEGFITENHDKAALEQTPGTQYIVVDCGGGTIDITVHEVLDGGALKELHKASGNDMGGQTVDKKFKDFLKEIFSDGVWDEYEKKHPNEVQKIMYDFTHLKQADDDVQITCSVNLGTLAQKKKEIEKYFETVQGASWNDGSIKISKEKLRSFFDESLRGITKSLSDIFNKDFSIEYILLVGGYSSSMILRRHITDQFGSQCKVLCPFRAQEAIVKGAVMFGRNPQVVASRKSAFTYGVAVVHRFDESKHKAGKKFTTEEGEWCNDIFSTLVEEGEDVGWDEVREHIFNPVRANQTGMSMRFYHTERKNPKYVDEWGIEEVGSFGVSMPDTKGGTKRQVKLEIKFGSTEITATATDKVSGSTESIKMDFMTKAPGCFKSIQNAAVSLTG